MFLGIRKKYWYYLIASLLMIGLMVFFQLSPAFALKRIDWQGSFTKDLDKVSKDFLYPNQNLFRFDRKELAQILLGREDIINAHLSLKLPDGICGEINRFDPAALIIDNGLYALDRHCRLIPYESAWDEISLPVFTGLKKPRIFHIPDDFRVAQIMDGLLEIENEIPELYGQIAEIDFSNDVYVGIYLTTGTDRYLATARDFTSQLVKLDMVRRTVGRSDDGCYNLLFDGIVIKQR